MRWAPRCSACTPPATRRAAGRIPTAAIAWIATMPPRANTWASPRRPCDGAPRSNTRASWTSSPSTMPSPHSNGSTRHALARRATECRSGGSVVLVGLFLDIGRAQRDVDVLLDARARVVLDIDTAGQLHEGSVERLRL